VERAHRADPEVAAQRELVARAQPDRLDVEREPLQPRQRGERAGEVVRDLGRHHDARWPLLARQAADAEQRRQRADVIGVAVRQEDRVGRRHRAQRDAGIEQEAELGHRERGVDTADGDAAHRMRSSSDGRQHRASIRGAPWFTGAHRHR